MASSVGLFVSTEGSGNITQLKEHTDWDKAAIIVPGNFGGDSHTDLLSYSRSAGVGHFVSTDSTGNIATLRQHADWDRDWDVIVPGNFGGDGRTDLLLYSRSTGVGLFASTDGSGNITTIRQHADWDRDWDVIVPGNFGGDGHTDLLLYSRSTGVGLFVSTDGSGNITTIRQHADWDRDWDVIVPGEFGGDGHTDLLFYKRASGVGLFASTDGSGNINTIREHTDWDRNWDLIVPGQFGGNGHTDLLLYRRSAGVGLFVSTDGSGNTATIREYTNWDRVWDAIIPGSFGTSGRTGLLFYSMRPTRPPTAPTSMHVTAVAAGQIDVAWTDQSNNEDGFRVQFLGKREGFGDHSGTVSRPSNAERSQSVTASLTGLLNKYEYKISVVAFNAAGDSPGSNTVAATTPNVKQTRIVSLRWNVPGGEEGGFPWYSGKFPEFGNVPPGRLLQIRLPESGLDLDWALSFVKRLHSTEECGNPDAVVRVGEGGATSPDQMKDIYGVAQPRYSSLEPINFVACFGGREAARLLLDIEITIMED